MDFAVSDMIPHLKAMWRACFGDNTVYTDFIFSRLITPEKILVHFDGQGKPAAMLCLQPFELVAGQEQVDAAYIYGVCTLPEHQGKGMSTALMEEAHCRLAAAGCAASALVPANEGLFGFYGNRGYETAFLIKKVRWEARNIPLASRSCSLTAASLGELYELREQQFGGCVPFVRWDRGYLEYIGDECALLGGEVLRVDDDGYAVCYPLADTLLVKELAVPDNRVTDVVAALHARFDKKEYLCYLRPDSGVACPNKVLPFAMIKWYDKENRIRQGLSGGRAAYISHVLD